MVPYHKAIPPTNYSFFKSVITNLTPKLLPQPSCQILSTNQLLHTQFPKEHHPAHTITTANRLVLAKSKPDCSLLISQHTLLGRLQTLLTATQDSRNILIYTVKEEMTPNDDYCLFVWFSSALLLPGSVFAASS